MLLQKGLINIVGQKWGKRYFSSCAGNLCPGNPGNLSMCQRAFYPVKNAIKDSVTLEVYRFTTVYLEYWKNTESGYGSFCCDATNLTSI